MSKTIDKGTQGGTARARVMTGVGLGAAAALVAAGAAAGAAQAAQAAGAQVQAAGAQEEQAGAESQAQGAGVEQVQEDQVEGTFAFTQGQADNNDWIVRHIAQGSTYSCGATAVSGEADQAAVEGWQLTVGGDVSSPYSATIGELASSDAVQQVVMGCTCAGNPADGTSVADALVKGIPATTLLAMAAPQEGANTVVFVSSDGYEVALPLSYLFSHYCPLVFAVNGSELASSVGGTNQLWLGSTPASYFARDVVEVRVETRDEAPASPTSDEAREQLGTLPNVGVLYGGEVC